VLIVRSVTLPGAGAGLKFLLHPDFSRLDADMILMALGQACFTLSIGMGAMITYGSYLSEESNMPLSALEIAGLDTMIAILAGVAIFPAVFAMGLQPDQGPGLIFNVLPVVFARMPGGVLFSALFFFLLSIAAVTSGISLLEVVTAYAIDEWGWSRRRAVILVSALVFIVGVPAALSFGVWSGATLLDRTVFDWMDMICSDYLLPIGVFLISIFVGWVWGVRDSEDAIARVTGHRRILVLWGFLVRWICPLLVGVILLYKFAG